MIYWFFYQCIYSWPMITQQGGGWQSLFQQFTQNNDQAQSRNGMPPRFSFDPKEIVLQSFQTNKILFLIVTLLISLLGVLLQYHTLFFSLPQVQYFFTTILHYNVPSVPVDSYINSILYIIKNGCILGWILWLIVSWRHAESYLGQQVIIVDGDSRQKNFFVAVKEELATIFRGWGNSLVFLWIFLLLFGTGGLFWFLLLQFLVLQRYLFASTGPEGKANIFSIYTSLLVCCKNSPWFIRYGVIAVLLGVGIQVALVQPGRYSGNKILNISTVFVQEWITVLLIYGCTLIHFVLVQEAKKNVETR